MISDVLSDALDEFEHYQTGDYEDFYSDDVKADVAEIEVLMRRLLVKLDTPPETPETVVDASELVTMDIDEIFAGMKAKIEKGEFFK